ncbi:alpha/beta hydrolase [Staphylococcus saccharolyticus]|uniref:Alpha/beta hydrolase n=1 Tax=Staphylococcus saccharolyticus TaxID=33028 RepID=A0A380HBF8_9STAP|nr:alpha/beta hydrolase [Staphylococcus saccharolyticus]
MNYRIDSYFDNIRKEVFSGSGHTPHIEEAEKFLNVYLDFIEQEES